MMTQINDLLQENLALHAETATTTHTEISHNNALSNYTNSVATVATALATRLRESTVINHLKIAEESASFSGHIDLDATHPLRFSIPLSTSLVDRFIAMPVVPGNVKTLGASRRNYTLSCDQDLGIWHASGDAIGVLNNFPLDVSANRVEFPYFVLWALSVVLPDLHTKLLGESFGPSKDILCKAFKELPAPIPYDHEEPPFKFNYGKVFGKSSIHPASLAHTFISGATGAGKTYGGVKPLLQSFLIYKNSQGSSMGMLVIDPKAELLQVCTTELRKAGESDRLFRLGSHKRVKFFKEDCELGLEERYRTLANTVQVKATGESVVWQEKGNRLNIEMAAADRGFQLQTGTLLWGVVRSLIEGQDHTQDSQWANILAVYKHAVYSRANLNWVACVSSALLLLCPGLQGKKSPFTAYTADTEMQAQLFYRVSNAEKVCADLGSPEIFNVISTDIFPSPMVDNASIDELLEQGKVMLLQPKSGYFGDIVGRLVKSRFFADVLNRQNMMLSVGYVADEFQRFITSDRETGDQSFLDRCRAYKVTCVLASQSLSSIEHALTQNGEIAPRLVVDIIVANSPTKIIYRSMDASTQKSLKEWIPPAPGNRNHVVDVRPAAQLPNGTAYFMCDGEWGMYRYQKLDTTQAH